MKVFKDFVFVAKEKFTNLVKRLDETEKDEEDSTVYYRYYYYYYFIFFFLFLFMIQANAGGTSNFDFQDQNIGEDNENFEGKFYINYYLN
jgi:hypothetical protein